MNGDNVNNNEDNRCITPIPSLALTCSSGSSNLVYKTPAPADDGVPYDQLFVNITPPKIRENRCVELAAGYGLTWRQCNNNQKRILSFLFDKNVHNLLQREVPDNVKEHLLEATDESCLVGQRASVLLYERGQSFFGETPDDVQTYEDFLEKCPWWKQQGSNSDYYINLFEAPYKLPVFQQCQLSGNCYLHGAVSVCQYLYHWHQVDQDDHVVDIPRYMRHTFDAHQISKHVFGVGENDRRSENILRNLVGPSVMRGECVFDFFKDDERIRAISVNHVRENMDVYGPHLVGKVLLSDNFGEEEEEVNSYKGADCTFPPPPADGEKDKRERHSLVLMGIQRIDHDWRFLFQNWHRRTQFFEADYDWACKSGGQVWSHGCNPKKWESPTMKEPYMAAEYDYTYSESSPAVDRDGSSDDTQSFLFE